MRNDYPLKDIFKNGFSLKTYTQINKVSDTGMYHIVAALKNSTLARFRVDCLTAKEQGLATIGEMLATNTSLKYFKMITSLEKITEKTAISIKNGLAIRLKKPDGLIELDILETINEDNNENDEELIELAEFIYEKTKPASSHGKVAQLITIAKAKRYNYSLENLIKKFRSVFASVFSLHYANLISKAKTDLTASDPEKRQTAQNILDGFSDLIRNIFNNNINEFTHEQIIAKLKEIYYGPGFDDEATFLVAFRSLRAYNKLQEINKLIIKPFLFTSA
jgi:hypothetical protein